MSSQPQRSLESEETLDAMAEALDPRQLAAQLQRQLLSLANEYDVRLTSGETKTLKHDAFTRNWQRVAGIYALVQRVRGTGGEKGPLSWEEISQALNS